MAQTERLRHQIFLSTDDPQTVEAFNAAVEWDVQVSVVASGRPQYEVPDLTLSEELQIVWQHTNEPYSALMQSLFPACAAICVAWDGLIDSLNRVRL